MNTQTNQSPADGRLSKQQANDRGGVVSWGEHVSDDVRIRPSLVWRGLLDAVVRALTWWLPGSGPREPAVARMPVRVLDVRRSPDEDPS